MRLIDADTLQFVPKGTKYVVGVKSFLNLMAAVQEAVDKTPTVDAVPVVRCKDCKYLLMLEGRDGRRIPLCSVQLGFVPLSHNIETWYCPLGERRCDNGTEKD